LLTFLARRDVIVGAIVLIIGVAYGLMTASLPDRSLPNTPGPAFFPWLITGGLLVLSVALLSRSLTVDGSESPQASSDRLAYRRVLFLLWFSVYLVILPYAGFLPASVPFFVGLMWLYGERNRLALTLATIIIPASLFYIFRLAFQILLPAGVW
jgi:putative tricarboxylic transport membrane protein